MSTDVILMDHIMIKHRNMQKQRMRCRFTTKSDLAKLSPKFIKIREFDTNTFPKFSGSELNHWTQAVLQKNFNDNLIFL